VAVNVETLVAEIAGTLVVTCLLYLALRDGRRSASRGEERERAEPPKNVGRQGRSEADEALA